MPSSFLEEVTSPLSSLFIISPAMPELQHFPLFCFADKKPGCEGQGHLLVGMLGSLISRLLQGQEK
jgi:hypothetical protein